MKLQSFACFYRLPLSDRTATFRIQREPAKMATGSLFRLTLGLMSFANVIAPISYQLG